MRFKRVVRAFRVFRTYVELIQSADDDEYTRRHFAHGEHVLDFDETLDAGVVDERDDTCVHERGY